MLRKGEKKKKKKKKKKKNGLLLLCMEVRHAGKLV
jgi:hypothetical protein